LADTDISVKHKYRPIYWPGRHIGRSVVATRFDVLFKSLNVTKTINVFLAHLRFLKKQQIFLNAAGHNACSPTTTKISIDILLPAAKTFGQKLA